MRLGLTIALAFAAPAVAQDYRELAGHGGPIMDISVSADGQHALTASFDNTVGYWALETGTVTWLDGHEAAVKSTLFITQDLAASSGDDFAVELWDLTTGQRRHRLSGHQGQVTGLAASPDGQTLASASWDGSIGLWSLADGTNQAYLTGHQAQVTDIAFAPDGALYSASADGTIRIWDTETRSQSQVLTRHGFGVTKLLMNPEQDWLIYGAVDGGTRVISLTSNDTLADFTLERRPILALAANPDGTQIAVGDGEGYIMVVDTQKWRITHDFHAAKTGPIWALAYTGDGKNLIAGGIDDKAVVWPIGATDAPLLTSERSFHKDPDQMSNGERQFQRKCSICHSLSDDGSRRAGPHLAGLFGRPAGRVPGYAYSDAVATSDIIWNDTTIDLLFDLGPDHYVPGTKMPMQRITRPKDRADLIAYLRDTTGR